MTDTSAQPTVLTVDDDPGVIDVIREYLHGVATVRTAGSGEAALAQVDTKVDVVLLDRGLPDMHGDDVLDELRRRHVDCGVVMLTDDKPDIDIATLHYNDYLVKPIDQGALRRTIDRVDALSDRAIQVQEYFALADKIHAVAEDEGRQLGVEVRELRERMAQLSERIEPSLTPIEEEIADELAEKWPQGPQTVTTSP